MKRFTNNDIREFADKLFDVMNKECAGHLVEPKNIDKEREKSFIQWVDKLKL